MKSLWLSFALVVVWLSFSAAKSVADPPPNIVYLLADDLGWSDLSIHPGGSIATPNIDRFFRQGIELQQFMGWCVCSPTRAMLLTGRHPFRVGTGPEVGGELSGREVTLAEAFRQHGYQTGVFGKWHNGEDPDVPEFRAAFTEAFRALPNKKLPGGLGVNAHGFDEAWVYYGGGADYFTRRTVSGRGPVSWWHNREFRPQDQGYTEDLITRHVVEFLRANRQRPFFCYVPFHLIHSPMQAKEEDLRLVPASITDPAKRTYAAMVQALDRNVAIILHELDALGLRDNTIVVFTSDNGATKEGSNLPLRGMKHTVYEGGTRLPTAIHWPRGGLAGGGSWEGLCGAMDMFPTLLAMAGFTLPPTEPLDGQNVWPALRDRQASPVDSYYWAWRNQDALRTAEWRMHRYFDHVELYHLPSDIGETRDVSRERPEVVQTLTAKMDRWAESLGAALSHRSPPVAWNRQPAPEGEVLEVSVTVTEQSQPKDLLVVPFASPEGQHFASDYVEFDLGVSSDTPAGGKYFYSPFRGNNSTPITLQFKRGEGIDQFGREQISAPPIQGGPGSWEHRILGLCSSAPGALHRQGIVFRGGQPGTYRIYLDNLRLRHADGTTSPLWTSGRDTRAQPIADSAAFRDIQVRAIPYSSLP
jgi:arylsulfatase A-like enzyme